MGIIIQAINNTNGDPIGSPNSVDATSISTQRYFPRKVEHTLMSGNMTTYTPNHITQLIIELQYLSKDDYEYIMTNISYRFKIISEESTNHPICHTTGVTYLYSGDTLDFSYSNQFQGAGFSGTLTFIETYT